jgi:hypothetical protein
VKLFTLECAETRPPPSPPPPSVIYYGVVKIWNGLFIIRVWVGCKYDDKFCTEKVIKSTSLCIVKS